MSQMETDLDRWLRPTEFLDHDHPDVAAFATRAVGDSDDPIERAVRLFYRVRDGFWYNPYSSSRTPDAFKASHIVHQSEGWCVPKSIVLTASARHLGIPARLGYADVRNHLQSQKLKEKMGTDLNRHMEYVRERGSYDDFPYHEMMAAIEELYGPDGPAADGESDELFRAPD